jgi:hypothetical protein
MAYSWPCTASELTRRLGLPQRQDHEVRRILARLGCKKVPSPHQQAHWIVTEEKARGVAAEVGRQLDSA